MPSLTTSNPPSIALATYTARQSPFHPDKTHIDEKVLTHDHQIIPHHETPSLRERFKVTHRDLSNLSVLAHVTRVQYGYFHDDPACLITFKFQFQGGSGHHAWRFDRAEVRVKFEACDGKEDPVVVDYGPKRFVSNGTDEKRDWWYSATLSATSLTPVAITPTASVSAGQSGSYQHHSATEVSSADFCDHEHREANIVKFWLREDERQKSRIPLEFDCAVIVKYSGGPFQATVDVKVGPVFDLLATPWAAEDPIVFEPGLEYGEQVKGGQIVDFAQFGAEEWRDLIAPDLTVSEMLNDQHNGK